MLIHSFKQTWISNGSALDKFPRAVHQAIFLDYDVLEELGAGASLKACEKKI